MSGEYVSVFSEAKIVGANVSVLFKRGKIRVTGTSMMRLRCGAGVRAREILQNSRVARPTRAGFTCIFPMLSHIIMKFSFHDVWMFKRTYVSVFFGGNMTWTWVNVFFRKNVAGTWLSVIFGENMSETWVIVFFGGDMSGNRVSVVFGENILECFRKISFPLLKSL